MTFGERALPRRCLTVIKWANCKANYCEKRCDIVIVELREKRKGSLKNGIQTW